MLKYVIFLLGILFFLLYNGKDGFSVGIQHYEDGSIVEYIDILPINVNNIDIKNLILYGRVRQVHPGIFGTTYTVRWYYTDQFQQDIPPQYVDHIHTENQFTIYLGVVPHTTLPMTIQIPIALRHRTNVHQLCASSFRA